jgi:hypothetical protein
VEIFPYVKIISLVFVAGRIERCSNFSPFKCYA